MSDEDALSQAAAKAARAQHLLQNELLTEAFAALEAAYTADWRATALEDVNRREKLFMAISVVEKIREHLNSVITDGKLAADKLKQLTERRAQRRYF